MLFTLAAIFFVLPLLASPVLYVHEAFGLEVWQVEKWPLVNAMALSWAMSALCGVSLYVVSFVGMGGRSNG